MVLSVGRHSLATPRRTHRSRVLAAIIVPATVLLTAAGAAFPGSEPYPNPVANPASAASVMCCAELVASMPLTPDPTMAGARYRIGDAPRTSSYLVAARGASRDPLSALPVGIAPEAGLQVKTILVARAVSAVFPEITSIGGVRADSLRWHPEGLAIDVMIPDYHSAAGKALGDSIVRFVWAHADQFGLDHIIWRQVMYSRNGTAQVLSDYGSDNANHYTHVHIATTGGGYPSGSELYVR